MGKEKYLNLVDYYDVESPEASEFRRLLHNLNGLKSPQNKRSIMITSSMVSEGKSLISSFLAMTAARHKGRKTLLIDFDLRRPTIHRLFGLSREKGIAEVLLDGAAVRTVVKQTALEKLDILTAGRHLDNPSDIINGPAIHKLLEELKFYYELILIDTSPVVPVSDPLILMDEVDGVLLVVKAGSTPRGVITRTTGLLARQKEKVLGVVVNNLTHSLPYYYNYSYYGYNYSPTKE